MSIYILVIIKLVIFDEIKLLILSVVILIFSIGKPMHMDNLVIESLEIE